MICLFFQFFWIPCKLRILLEHSDAWKIADFLVRINMTSWQALNLSFLSNHLVRVNQHSINHHWPSGPPSDPQNINPPKKNNTKQPHLRSLFSKHYHGIMASSKPQTKFPFLWNQSTIPSFRASIRHPKHWKKNTPKILHFPISIFKVLTWRHGKPYNPQQYNPTWRSVSLPYAPYHWAFRGPPDPLVTSENGIF